MRYVKYIIKYIRNVKRYKLNVNFQRLKLKFNFSRVIDKINFIYQCNCSKPILKFTQIKLMVNEFMAFLF